MQLTQSRKKFLLLLPVFILILHASYFRYTIHEIEYAMLEANRIPVWFSIGQWVSMVVTFMLNVYLILLVVINCSKKAVTGGDRDV
jgi:hypothetical protein